MRKFEVFEVPNFPIVREGDDIAEIIIDCLKKENLKVIDGDVIVVAETIVSKAEGNVLDLSNVRVSEKAKKLAKKTGKDERLVQAILDEAKEIVAVGDGPIIVETHHGFVCASAGIDHSNVKGLKDFVALLPKNPDKTAEKIRKRIEREYGKKIAVLINDTQGRPFRVGAVGTAIGVSGLHPVWVRAGDVDLYGYVLEASPIAIADELASAASILMGQADEGIPVVIVRGARYKAGEGTSKDLIRRKEKDLFR